MSTSDFFEANAMTSEQDMRNFARPSIAVAFLARGAHANCRAFCEQFLRSYQRHRAGVAHSLYIIFKGFANAECLDEVRGVFNQTPHTAMFLGDDSFDIGAYIEWANALSEDIICPLNTSAQILADDWLKKMAVNLALPNVGLVGATASYESLNDWNADFPPFPNPHVRSNAFMIRRDLFCEATEGLQIKEKLDAFNFESGAASLTRLVMKKGREILVVGRNGRGYAIPHWPVSETFRLRFQRNLLVADNQTRNFSAMRWTEKHELGLRTWGHFIREQETLSVN